MVDLALLAHPSLPLLVAAAVVALLPRRAAGAVLLGAPVVSLWLVIAARDVVGPTIDLYGFVLTPLRVDRLSLVFAAVFALAAFLSFLYGLAGSTRTERVAGLVTAAAAIGVAGAGDLITLFIWWEMKAVATAVIIVAHRTAAGRDAALRYLYAHLAGGAALLVGVAWHLAATGSAEFWVLAGSPAAPFILLGFLLSAAAVGLHVWLPDAYPQASVSGTVLLSAFTTKAAVYALVRGFPGVQLLVWVGVVMALYGVVFAMVQNDLRRLLSYHIVSQVGFMVAAVGVGTEAAINGATAHAAAHIVYKGLLLMGVGVVIHATGRREATELGGLGRMLPTTLVLYLIGALSISGVPGFSGFVSKELTIHALGDAGWGVAVVALKVASVGTLLSTLGKLPYATWIAPARATDPPSIVRRPRPTMYAAMVVAAAICVVVGIAPQLLWDPLPYANSYTPWQVGKVLETSQLLGVAGLGFWLLRRQLAPHHGAVLELDHAYRTLPMWIAARISAVSDAFTQTVDRCVRTVGPRVGTGRRAVPWAAVLPGTKPTWWFGVVLLTVGFVVTVASVLT